MINHRYLRFLSLAVFIYRLYFMILVTTKSYCCHAFAPLSSSSSCLDNISRTNMISSRCSIFMASSSSRKTRQYLPFLLNEHGSFNHRHNHHCASLYMRDTSMSYWFTVGDQVQVVKDVIMTKTDRNNNKIRINLRNRIGTVITTWEKCDVDPTCCCAEQVDTNMAVYVEFQQSSSSFDQQSSSLDQQSQQQRTTEDCETIKNKGDESMISNINEMKSMNDNNETIRYYFSEEELIKITTPIQKFDESNNNHLLPFDGLSCVAFKSKEIEKNQKQPRRIASYEP